jgi:hypothetical protein
MPKKTDLITFKVEPALAELINQMPNKSDFIRKAILSTLNNTCPLCQGTGVLTTHQRKHWDDLSAHHHMKRCGECHSMYLLCDARGG